ncbi:hypothetical protein ACP4OV_021716 [Aristida adscensionis]
MVWMETVKPVLTMLAFDARFAVMTALIKKLQAQGLNPVVLIALRQFVAAVFLAPIAYFKERNARPKFTKEIFAYLFMSALIGVLSVQYLFFLGLSYTTATLAATISNMNTVLTFVMAVVFRVETVDVKSKAGLAKTIGTLTSAGGVTLLSVYKGAALTHTASSAHEHAGTGSGGGGAASQGRWILGSAFVLANCVMFSLWMLLQGKLTKKYPAVVSSTAFMALFSSLQAVMLALMTQRRLSVWFIRGSVQITTIIFARSGVVRDRLCVLMTWCIEKRGPVANRPVARWQSAGAGAEPVMAAVIDLFILHEELYLGNAVGAVLIVAGLLPSSLGESMDTTPTAKDAALTTLSAKGVKPEKQVNL